MSPDQPKKPSVSVIVCTFNRGDYLARCLDSIYAQDFKDFEVIVVNGPSTDNTEAVLARYPGVRVVRQGTLAGIANARNIGVRAAEADIVAFFDDDAVAPESWLGILVNRLNSDTSICGVGGMVLDIGSDHVQFANGVVDIYGKSTPILPVPQKHYDSGGKIFNNIIGMNSAFRKKAIDRISGFDERFSYYYEETDMCVRLILSGCKVVHEPNAVIWHDFATSHNRRSKWDQNWYIISRMTIYFSLKNFGRNMGVYGRGFKPFLGYLKQLRSFIIPFLRGEIPPALLVKIYTDVTRGFIDGIRDGKAVGAQLSGQ